LGAEPPAPALAAWALRMAGSGANEWAAVVAEQRAWVRRLVWVPAEAGGTSALYRRGDRCGHRFWGRFERFCRFLFQPDDFRFQFARRKESSSDVPLA